MKVKILVEKEVDLAFLKVDAGVRYWNDSKINGVDDTDVEETDGEPQMPCAEYIGEQKRVLKGSDWRWRPVIGIESGKITNWPQGMKASIHYKVCDDGTYTLIDCDGSEVASVDGYVPRIMCPKENGYGDYIIMDIDENGFIQGWNKELIIKLVKQEED